MRGLGYAAFAVLAVILLGVFGLGIYATINDEDVDTAAAAARKAECRKVVRRYFELAGVAADQLDARMARVPIEDIEQCGAALPESTACMQAAPSLDAYHACVPTQIECANGAAEVTSKHPVNELGAGCKTVRVTGSNITVVAEKIDTLDIIGSDNTIRVGAAKTVTDRGQRNKITR